VFKAVCYLHETLDPYHASTAITGLVSLAQANKITLEFRELPSCEYEQDQAAVVQLDLSHRGRPGLCRRVAIDLFDRSDYVVMGALSRSDVYWKRSFHPPDIAALPGGLGTRIRPFGLNYATRTLQSTAAIAVRAIPILLRSCAPLQKGGPRRFRGVLRDRFHEWKTFFQLPIQDFYEWPPAAEVEPVVFFQPRLWDASEAGPDSIAEVNRTRLELVLALKRAFGSRFHGGLVPTPYARKYHPELITTAPHRRQEYIAYSKRRLVTVCTRGLHHSMPFKVAEALASSKVILTEPLRNQLSQPLLSDEHWLEFRNPDECVAQCAMLLRDTARAKRMRESTWQYYQAHVRPDAHMLGVISESLS